MEELSHQKTIKNYLFVYGSLLSHNSHHHLLEGNRFIGNAILEDYALYKIAWYPGIIPKKGAKVLGEVYEIDKNTLKIIDEFEDEGELYQRKKVKITLENKQKLEAWTYIYLHEVKEENYIPFEEQPWRDEKY